jgi:hypothetical protein
MKLDMVELGAVLKGVRTWCHADIIKGEVSNPRVQLQQKGQRLTNSTGSTEDCDFRQLQDQFISQRLTAYMKLNGCIGDSSGTVRRSTYISGRRGESSALGSARQCSSCSEHDEICDVCWRIEELESGSIWNQLGEERTDGKFQDGGVD